MTGEKVKYETFQDDLRDELTGPLKGYSLEEAVEHIGIGWPQIRLGILSGFAWVADGMEIMVLSILGPVLLCDWHITTIQEAFITTVVFIGFLFGSIAFGNLADKYGRKKSLLFSAVWVLFYGIMSTFSPNLFWILLLRCLVGFGIGGGPQAVTYFAEFLPSKSRGKLIILVEVLWALGGMLTALLALFLMPYGWRVWLLATGTPVLLFVIFTFFLPTSPHFDLACGRREEAQRTLEQLARANGKTLPPGELLSIEVKERGRVKDLLTPHFRRTSALLAFLWFSAAFLYYGLILFTTDFIKAGNTCQGANMVSYVESEDLACAAECDSLTTSDYFELIWTSAAELPGLFLTVFLIDIIGRKMSVLVELLVLSLCCGLLCICMSNIPMMILLFTGRAFASSAFQVLYVYTSEVYPTKVRALSVGVGSSFGRAGAIITPYIAEVLLARSIYIGLSVYAGIAVLGAIAAFLLPIETKGRDLAEDCS